MLLGCGAASILSATHANAAEGDRQAGGVEQPWHGLRGINGQWDRRDHRSTQGLAYVSTKGPEEVDNPGEPFNAYSTEPLADPAGAYFSDGKLHIQ